MKVIKTKKLVEEIDNFGSDPFDKIPDVVGSTTGSMYAQIPYAGADAIAKAKEHSKEIKKMAKKQVDDANKSGALKNTEKDRTEIKKVKSPDLKKMHLSENLGDEKLTEETNYEKVMKVLKNYKKEEALTEAEEADDFDEFLKNAEIIVVDDAKSFDINKWEDDYRRDVEEELDVVHDDKVEDAPKFIKYKLDGDNLNKVLEKLSTSEFSFLDGSTSWKTKQFLKKKGLKLSDLQDVLRSLTPEDYKTNSKPVDETSGYSEAIIFIKNNVKIKDLGPLNLYIKLDYDTVEETPVIIISLHLDFKKESLTEAEDDIKNEFDVEDLADKYDPKAVKFEDNGYGLFSVLLEDEGVDFSTWMDVAVKDGDVNTDWNQYIFYMTDPRDRFNKAMQENAEVFDKADNAAVNYLLDQGVIIQNEDSTWSVVEKALESLKESLNEDYNEPVDDEVEKTVKDLLGDVDGDAKSGFYLMDEDECKFARKLLDAKFGNAIRLDFVKVTEDDPNFEDFKWLMKVSKSANREGINDDLLADVLDALSRGATWSRKRPDGLKDKDGTNFVSYDYTEVTNKSKNGDEIVTVISPDKDGLKYAYKVAKYYGLDYELKRLPQPIKGDVDSRFPYYNYSIDIVVPSFTMSTAKPVDDEDEGEDL